MSGHMRCLEGVSNSCLERESAIWSRLRETGTPGRPLRIGGALLRSGTRRIRSSSKHSAGYTNVRRNPSLDNPARGRCLLLCVFGFPLRTRSPTTPLTLLRDVGDTFAHPSAQGLQIWSVRSSALDGASGARRTSVEPPRRHATSWAFITTGWKTGDTGRHTGRDTAGPSRACPPSSVSQGSTVFGEVLPMVSH